LRCLWGRNKSKLRTDKLRTLPPGFPIRLLLHSITTYLGKFSNNTINSECTDCAAGTYQPNLNSTSCLFCPPGQGMSGLSKCSLTQYSHIQYSLQARIPRPMLSLVGTALKAEFRSGMEQHCAPHAPPAPIKVLLARAFAKTAPQGS